MAKRQSNGVAEAEDFEEEEVAEDEDSEEEDDEENCEAEDSGDSEDEDEEEEVSRGENVQESYVSVAENERILSIKEWKDIFAAGDQGLVGRAQEIKVPFQKASIESPWEPSEHLRNLLKGFLLYLNSDELLRTKDLSVLSRALVGRIDVFVWLARISEETFKSWKKPAKCCWKNCISFVKSLPSPSDNILSAVYEGKGRSYKKKEKAKVLMNSFEEFVLAVTKQELSVSVALSLMAWLSSGPLSQMNTPQLFAQFFFSHFSQGSTHAIFALEGLLVLVLEHNFEYPKLFEEVYLLTTPASFCLHHKKKLFDILDTMLKSTHLANYIVASFAKRLSRCLLYTPFDVQESLLGLIRNIITRHPTVSFLLQREEPKSLEEDPFEEDERDLTKTRATDSSLWEIKTLQCHWLLPVAKRARFIDGGIQKMESFVRFRVADDYWNETMTKPYGEELIKREYSEEEEDILRKRKVPIVETSPDALFTKKSFLAYYETVWSL